MISDMETKVLIQLFCSCVRPRQRESQIYGFTECHGCTLIMTFCRFSAGGIKELLLDIIKKKCPLCPVLHADDDLGQAHLGLGAGAGKPGSLQSETTGRVGTSFYISPGVSLHLAHRNTQTHTGNTPSPPGSFSSLSCEAGPSCVVCSIVLVVYGWKFSMTDRVEEHIRMLERSDTSRLGWACLAIPVMGIRLWDPTGGCKEGCQLQKFVRGHISGDKPSELQWSIAPRRLSVNGGCSRPADRGRGFGSQ
jgi:hypothetical protein